MRLSALITLILLSLSIAAPAHARSGRLALCYRALLDIFQTGPRAELLGKSIEEEIDPAVREHYFPGNEFHMERYERFIKDKDGVLISVGSFGGLQLSTYGDFAHVILFDYDPGIGEFNRVNLELIRRAKTRAEYLSLLIAGDFSLAEKIAAAGTGAGLIDLLESSQKRFELIRLWEKLGIVFKRESAEHKQLLSGLDMMYLGSMKRATLFLIMRGYMNEGTFANTIFSNDEVFEKVKTRADSGGFTVLTGSVAGLKTIHRIGAILKKRNLKISVFNNSNVWRHLIKTKQDEIVERFFANLEALPWSDKAVILNTTFNRNATVLQDQNLDRWSYHADTPGDFLRVRRDLMVKYGIKKIEERALF